MVGICRASNRPGECGTWPCFRWVQTQNRSPDTPGGSKIVSGLVSIPLRCQAINIAPPKRRRAWVGGRHPDARGCRSWCTRHECQLHGIHIRRHRMTVTGTRTQPTRFLYRPTRLTVVCSVRHRRFCLLFLLLTSWTFWSFIAIGLNIVVFGITWFVYNYVRIVFFYGYFCICLLFQQNLRLDICKSSSIFEIQ